MSDKKIDLGRLSTTPKGPNMQNIPIRTPEGRRIRDAFRGQGERVHVVGDFDQIEMRALKCVRTACPKCSSDRAVRFLDTGKIYCLECSNG